MVIRFSVDGTPPKKDGANSMWRKRTEVPKLKALRTAASNAMGEIPPQQQAIHLTIKIYTEAKSGDLDNFITGICDGLQSVHPRTLINENNWLDVPTQIHPSRPIVFLDDSCVSKIVAERIPPTDGRIFYEIIVAGD